MSNKNSNFPNAVYDRELSKQEGTCTAIISDIQCLMDLNRLGKPKNEEELKERIRQYFEFCKNYDVRPGCESLCLSLCCGKSTLHRWSRGEGVSKEWCEIINTARQMLASFWEQSFVKGKVNPVASIFLGKNWFGYRDSVEIVSESDYDKKPLTLADLPKLDTITNKIKESKESEMINTEMPFSKFGEQIKSPLPYGIDEEFI